MLIRRGWKEQYKLIEITMTFNCTFYYGASVIAEMQYLFATDVGPRKVLAWLNHVAVTGFGITHIT